MRHLFQRGMFTLAFGGPSSWKIDCDSLTREDWDTIAHIAATNIPNFKSVEGVPRGGLLFAEAMEQFCWAWGEPLLIVDDVLTTGQSMENFRRNRDAMGIVLFARGPCPAWIRPVFQFSL